MGEQLTANRPNTPVDKMTDDLQQFFRKMAEEEAEAGESADGGTAGESMDNDADMLKEAGVGIAVGNASGLAMEAADMVVPHHDRDGVAAGIYQLLGK